MALELAVKQALSRNGGVRRIVREWRALTGGARVRDADRRTLIACSGGVDSSALVLALASASEHLVVAHVVHDLRSPKEALTDRDAARTLAERMGMTFAEASATTKCEKGNREGVARRMRYAALAKLAKEHGCVAIATAHQADDQLETVLMRLMRGAGMRGMGGVAPSRTMGGIQIVRPMLGVTRADAMGVCVLAEWTWREDATNTDTRMLRAMLRREVVPALRARCPSVARRATEFARMASEAAGVVQDHARRLVRDAKVVGDGLVWDRGEMRAERAIVVGEVLRLLHARWMGEGGRDRLRWTSVERVHAAIADGGEHRRVFHVAGMEIVVDAVRVVVRRKREQKARG